MRCSRSADIARKDATPSKASDCVHLMSQLLPCWLSALVVDLRMLFARRDLGFDLEIRASKASRSSARH